MNGSGSWDKCEAEQRHVHEETHVEGKYVDATACRPPSATTMEFAVYRDGERAERGEVTLAEAASRLAVSSMTVIRLIKGHLLPAKQACISAPYVICETDLDLSIVRHAIENGRAVSVNPRQGTLEYQ